MKIERVLSLASDGFAQEGGLKEGKASGRLNCGTVHFVSRRTFTN